LVASGEGHPITGIRTTAETVPERHAPWEASHHAAFLDATLTRCCTTPGNCSETGAPQRGQEVVEGVDEHTRWTERIEHVGDGPRAARVGFSG
jgi:hypothetical protein